MLLFGVFWMAVQDEQWRDPTFLPKRPSLAQARLAKTGPNSHSSSRSGGELSFKRDTISLRRERRA